MCRVLTTSRPPLETDPTAVALKVPGSPSAALAMTDVCYTERRTSVSVRHLTTVGKSAPPPSRAGIGNGGDEIVGIGLRCR